VKVSSFVASLSLGIGIRLASAGIVAAGTPGPVFDPHNFSGHPIDNVWFPLTPGTRLIYKGDDQGARGTDEFHITQRTRTILGVSCVVIDDSVIDNGLLVEHTLDFYAQDDDGNVWYMGEKTAEYDSSGHVVSREGSWQAGVNGARAGVFMPADPHVGDSYEQEFYAGHAEDHFTITNMDASVSTPYGDFNHAMRTKEWTPLEPGIRDAKFYVRGIGEVLEKTVVGPTETFKLVQIITN
jgi:hypothetical protein